MFKSINLSNADITNEEINVVIETMRSGRLALGPKITEFENYIANYIGGSYAIAVNSGTSALHLLVKCLGINKGDEIITTPFSFIASANCALYEGAKPIFVDIEQKTLNIDPEKIEEAINKKTKALIIVDIFGHPADWDPILKIARKYKLKVIEDSCEALGAEYKKKKCGIFGDASVFAFYPNKQITTCGEGGIIITNKKHIANLCRSMHNQGRAIKNGKWLEHVRLGYNYRMTDMQAAMGIIQLRRIEEILKKRQQVATFYNEALIHIPEINIPYVAPWAQISWFVYVIQLSKNYNRKDRDYILERLRRAGVQCSNYFQCIHLQPFYKKLFGHKRGDFPLAESASDRTIALPFYNNLTKPQINYIVNKLKKCL